MADDEFAFLPDNAAEVGLPWKGTPAVRRTAVGVGDGHEISAIVWGETPPELVLIHGGGQNAHTWDTVALALDRPLVALDLPGHGHSSWWDDGAYEVARMADDVSIAVNNLAPGARAVVGMSLGAATALALAGRHPTLVRRLGLVDATPGGPGDGAKEIGAFIRGPESFASLDEILDRTMKFNPTRSESSLRRGVIHNTREREDGRWSWRHHPGNEPGVQFLGIGDDQAWDYLSGVAVPILLVLGADSTVVRPENVEEFTRRRPDTRVVTVAGAGHSVQGDQPLELAKLLAELLDG
jgi:pimeloyl-ACP methyl ester carboxylesterase